MTVDNLRPKEDNQRERQRQRQRDKDREVLWLAKYQNN